MMQRGDEGQDESPGSDEGSSAAGSGTILPLGAEWASDELADPGPVPTAVEREQLHEIRKTVLYGIGGLLTLSVVLYPVLAMFRPEAAEQFAGMSQSVTTGLLGIGGTAAGYAFGRHK